MASILVCVACKFILGVGSICGFIELQSFSQFVADLGKDRNMKTILWISNKSNNTNQYIIIS